MVKKDVISKLARSCSARFSADVSGEVGCLILIAMLVSIIGLFAIWWPLGLTAIAYGTYFESKVKRNLKLFNSTVQYPTAVESW